MFEFGDYVKIDLERAAAYKPLGLNETNNIGKIIWHDEESMRFCVEFLENVHGHNGNEIYCHGKPGHCWWFKKEYIIKTDHKAMSFFVKSINTDIYVKNDRFYYTETEKEVTDPVSICKIIKETTKLRR